MSSIIKDIEGLNITFRDGEIEREINILDLFEIDETSMTQEFSRQAAVYAYFAVLAAKAEYMCGKVDLAVEQEYAQADLATRDEFAKNDKKFTEAVVKSYIMTDEQYIELVESGLLSKYDHKLIKAIVSALEQRANMLISMGSFMRHELDQTGMNVRERVYEKSVEGVKDVLRNRKSKKI